MGSFVHLTETEKETIMKQFVSVLEESLRVDRQRASCVIEKYRERKLEVGRMREFYLDVTLCSKVVYFSRFDFIDNLYQARAVSQVSVVQLHVYNAQEKKRISFLLNVT